MVLSLSVRRKDITHQRLLNIQTPIVVELNFNNCLVSQKPAGKSNNDLPTSKQSTYQTDLSDSTDHSDMSVSRNNSDMSNSTNYSDLSDSTVQPDELSSESNLIHNKNHKH